MIKYVLYLKQGKMPFIRTENMVKVNNPLSVGQIFSYHQLNISRAIVKKCVFLHNEFRVYLEK